MPCARSQLLRERRAVRALALLLGATALGACSFGGGEAESAPNTCTLPADCASDLSCQAGVCVMRWTDAPLDVTLEVTPQRMPDGSQPFPILYGPFALQGGPRNFELPAPIMITGRVHDGPEIINAQLTFVPTKAHPSLAKPIQARSGLSTLRATFTVQLLAGVAYRVSVQPTESVVPPYSRVFVAERDVDLDINYKDLPTSTQSFLIRGAPAAELNIRARAKDGNQIISNTKRLGEGEGRATLTFASETPAPYRIEITAEQSLSARLLTPLGSCDSQRALVPTFTVDDTAFKREADTRSQGAFDLTLNLPPLPQPVQYEGQIQLCPQHPGVAGLPVSLRATALAFNNLPHGVSASYQVSVDAERETDRTHSFCTRVIPGEYVVLITPPAAINCEIFSERRQIISPSTEPDALELRVPAKLNGKILDGNMLPIANATIDAIALGIDTTMTLAEDDATVPIYNRSRQTSSNAGGSFALYVDVGMYDLIIKPPSQSGFAWQIQPGVNVGSARREDFTTRVELSAPALVEGNLRYAGGSGQSSLAGAEVHAYTVEDEKTPYARGVEIGHTRADEHGGIMLFVSPEPQPPW